MGTTVHCRNANCTFNKYDWSIAHSICRGKNEEVYINEEGRCALFIPKPVERRCPWPCDSMKPYAGRNFCPFCGRDLREENL